MLIQRKGTKGKRVYKYNLNSSTQADFQNVLEANKVLKRVSKHPLRVSLEQLTPVTVLTIEGPFKEGSEPGSDVCRVRAGVYRFSSLMNLRIETVFSKDKNALLVRLKRN